MAGVPASRGRNGTALSRNGRPSGAPSLTAKSCSDGYSPQRCNRRFRNGAAISPPQGSPPMRKLDLSRYLDDTLAQNLTRQMP
jgi:hypothetical protein